MIISLACLYAPVLFQGSRLGQLRIYTIQGILFCNITNCSSAVLERKIFEHFSYTFMNFETVFGPQNWSAGHGLNNFEHFKIFTILRRFYLTIDISGAVNLQCNLCATDSVLNTIYLRKKFQWDSYNTLQTFIDLFQTKLPIKGTDHSHINWPLKIKITA